jgi:hypothetical protein
MSSPLWVTVKSITFGNHFPISLPSLLDLRTFNSKVQKLIFYFIIRYVWSMEPKTDRANIHYICGMVNQVEKGITLQLGTITFTNRQPDSSTCITQSPNSKLCCGHGYKTITIKRDCIMYYANSDNWLESWEKSLCKILSLIKVLSFRHSKKLLHQSKAASIKETYTALLES